MAAAEKAGPVPGASGPDATDYSWLHPGVQARLCNLAKFPKLEGQSVQVLSWREEKGRWNCLLPNGGDVNVYPANLEPEAMHADKVKAIEEMLEEGRLLDAWRAVRGSASSPPALQAALEAKLTSLWEVAEDRLELVEWPGRGKGYRAKRAIKRGDTLLTDRALCSHALPPPPKRPVAVSKDTTVVDLDEEDEPAQERAAEPRKEDPVDTPYHKMATGLPPLVRILEGHTWECTREPGHVAYFVAAGYFNHSCCPNAFADASRSECTVRALSDICEGDEVCISYVPVSDNLKKRRQKLKPYGFLCACKRCEEEAKDDPFVKVPCKCGEWNFTFGTFSEGVLMDQKCQRCGYRFERDQSRRNLMVVSEVNSKQAEAVVDPNERHEVVWEQLKKLTLLEKVVAKGGPSAVPSLHPEAIVMLENFAGLHLRLALRLKGGQKASAFQAFHRYKKQCLERLEEKHGNLTNHRDASYLRTLQALATTEGCSEEESAEYRRHLEELCQTSFGQPGLPAALAA